MLKTQRFFNVLIIVAMLLGLFVLQPHVAAQPAGPDLQPVSADDIIEVQRTTGKGEVMYEVKGATGPATYIIQLEAAPLASYRGEVSGLMATSPIATGAKKLNVNSAASRAYRAYLAEERDTFLQQVQQKVDRDVKVLYAYEVAYNGVAVELTPEEAAQVAQMPGVRRVIRNFERYIQTDTSPEYLNAVGIWDGTNTGGLAGTMGEGIVVGIIDTGINMDHPSFADVGDDGYDHTNPLGAGTYTGWCNPAHPNYNSALVCNDKLIGVYSYPDSGNNPEDDNSHGSHTASTTAGNVLDTPTIGAGLVFTQMSGMAPHANIIAYDVCTGNGCQLTSIQAAIEDAVLDGVDVINYSIGGGPTSPWEDPDSEAYLNARDAGVFVATSAGNDGPDPGTAGSPGNAPWLTTVANGTHNRGFAANGVADMQGGTPPANIPGTGVSGEYTERIVYAADYGNALCGSGPQETPTNPFAPGTWDGEIVVCDRGTYYLVDKAAHVLAAGAGGVIIANTLATGAQTFATDLGMPGTHVTYDNGELLRAWLVDSDTNVYTATITASPIIHADDLGGILAAGSSRGPNVNANFIKPDIMAPGSNILAAYAGDADSFGLMSGTSMASPHVAGAAALIRALYPAWTPAEVQSALMMTSWTQDLFKDDGTTPADPFDVGAGRLDLTGTALAGLVLDETTANFEAADPGAAGDPTTLNLASLANASCLQGCSWERTFRNTTGEAITWTVSITGDVAMVANPAVFTVAAGATQAVEFTADVSEEDDGVWLFGTVILTANDPDLPKQHLPVAVSPTSGVLPDLVTINTHRNAGAQMIEEVQAIEILTMTVETFGLVQADLHDISLSQDPTNGDAYDDLDQVYYTLAAVPAGAKRLVAEITASEAPDVDLFVLYDTGAGYTEVCKSATSTWAEYCDITDPDAGDYLIIVQNWQGSANQPDDITLALGVVPGTDAGNMEIEGPASVAEMEPFDLQLFWDTPEMVAGDRWYGAFSLGSEPSKAGNIGTIPVDVIRWEDDVVKDATAVKVGDDITITYQLTVQPNISSADYTLSLTDTIPTGLTYVASSATATAGVVNVTGDTLTWEGLMNIPAPGQYLMSISEDNLDCAMPLANSGAYVDLFPYGLAANSAINGDSLWFTAFSSGAPFTFWDNQYTGIGFTDDGMAFFDSTPGTTPWVNQDIPNAADPNNLLAVFWNDWEVVYDGPTNRGVSLVTLGGTGAAGGAVIEYDDVQAYGEPGETLDFELFVWRTPDAAIGDPDIIFAYDNISLTTPITIGTIGIENALGTAGVKYAYDDAALQTLEDGMAICFDWYVAPTDPVVITYQVTVDDPTEVAEYTNVVEHDTDAPSTVVETTSHTISIDNQPPTIVKTVSPEYISNHGDIVTYTIKLTNPNIYPIDAVTMTDTLPPQLTFEDWVEQPAGATLVPPRTIEWEGTIPAEGTVEFIFTASTPVDTHSILIDIVNTAYMGYPGGSDSDSVSFSLIRKIYLPLIMRAFTTP